MGVAQVIDEGEEYRTFENDHVRTRVALHRSHLQVG
jgi:hypothetical protein